MPLNSVLNWNVEVSTHTLDFWSYLQLGLQSTELCLSTIHFRLFYINFLLSSYIIHYTARSLRRSVLASLQTLIQFSLSFASIKSSAMPTHYVFNVVYKFRFGLSTVLFSKNHFRNKITSQSILSIVSVYRYLIVDMVLFQACQQPIHLYSPLPI